LITFSHPLTYAAFRSSSYPLTYSLGYWHNGGPTIMLPTPLSSMHDPLPSSSVSPLHLRRTSLILPQFDQTLILLFIYFVSPFRSHFLFYSCRVCQTTFISLDEVSSTAAHPQHTHIPIYLTAQCVLELATLLFIIISPFTNSFYISTVGIYLTTAHHATSYLHLAILLLKSIFECRLRARLREFRKSRNTHRPTQVLQMQN